MSDKDKDKKSIDDHIKEKELERFNAEIARIEEERKKLELERKELERKSHLHWYKKPLFIQAIIAGVVAVPLIWFYVKDVALPLSRRENIRLSKEIEERDQELVKKENHLNSMKVKHEIKEEEYLKNLKELKADYKKVESIRDGLAKKYESLSNENNGYKEKYALAMETLEKQKGEFEDKKLVISEAIEQGEYISDEKAELLFLNKDRRPQTYTVNDFEEKTINGENVVIDKATGLTWQQSGSGRYSNYEDAKTYIKKLNSDKHAGYNDWRLPTLKEAITLLEQEKKSNGMYIDPVFDKKQHWIWTSDKLSASVAWVVNFDYGYCYGYGFSDDYYVRAVR